MHSQGVSTQEGQKESCELMPMTEYDGLVKGAESKYGAASPVILTQFHPEMYERPKAELGNRTLNKLFKICTRAYTYLFRTQSENNTKVLKLFRDCAQAKKAKRRVITPEALPEAKSRLRKVE